MFAVRRRTRFALGAAVVLASLSPARSFASAAAAASPEAAQSAPASGGRAASEDSASPLPSPAQVEQQIAALKAIEKPSEQERARLERLAAIAESLGRIEVQRAKAAEWREMIAQKAARLEKLSVPPPALPTPPTDASIEQLDAALSMVTAELASAREAIARLDTQATQLADRRRALPEELAGARSELAAARQALEAPPAAGAAGSDVASLAAAVRVEELTTLLSLREAELASLDVRSELADAERASHDQRVAAAEALGRSLRSDLDVRRTQLAQAAEQSAREHAGTTSSLAAKVTARNAELAQRLQDAGRTLNHISEEVAQREEELKRIDRDFTNDRERSRVASSTGKLSELLRRQRQALPSARSLAALVASRRELRGEIDLERIERTIELDALMAQERLAAQEPDQAQVLALLKAQREEYLRPLQKTLDSISTALVAVEGVEMRLAERVAEYRAFIDEKVMWLRSGPALWSLGPSAFADDLKSILEPLTSRAQWDLVVRQVLADPTWAYAGLGMAAALFLLRPFVRRWLERLAKEVTRGHSDRFVLTIEALFATVMLSMAAPCAMAGLGMALRSNEVGSPLAAGISAALLGTSMWTALLLFTRRLVRPQGVAIDHFSWRLEQAELLRRVAVRLFRWTVPLLLVAILCTRLPDQRGARPIATLVFLPCLVLLAWSAWTLFRPSNGLFASSAGKGPPRMVERIRWMWFPVVVGIPLTAFVLVVLGWGYAGVMLIDRLVASAALGIGTAVLGATLLRALEFGARALARRASAGAVNRGVSDLAQSAQKQEIRQDVATVSRQTLLTIRALTAVMLVGGLIAIWQDLVPALRALDDIHAWQGANGAVSLGSILWAIVIGAGAIFAAANLPGAVEVLFLQHAGMTPAGRYAAAAVMRYAIAIVAVVLVGGEIGLSWTSVQWLVAAVSVGLGFGLQEIVSNFISGLIVLFEQPVRIGDLVTVGDRTGMVVKIRIRATTIRDGDGKDLIVPNKHLITERVTNWTLPGTPLRLVLPVGVAYGTDLAMAERLLVQAARSVPTILDAPPVVPQLMGFGASSIDFELRAHVARVEDLMPSRHQLTKAVQSIFSGAGISIAFPQLDIHVNAATIERLVREEQR